MHIQSIVYLLILGGEADRATAGIMLTGDLGKENRQLERDLGFRHLLRELLEMFSKS